MSAVSAVVPAAGLSTRMRGPNKLLLPYQGTTIVTAVVRTLLSCELDVVVVTGRDREEVENAVAPARTVYNPDFELGLGSSIATGVKATPDYNAILIALGDMPAINAEAVQKLIDLLESDNIVVPSYTDQPNTPAHPVLFGTAFRAELESLRGESGAKGIIDANAYRTVRVVLPGALEDIDTPEQI